jgi:hypothetical protein
MVKTATNPAVEASTTARLANERATQTNDLDDIEHAISEWGKAVQLITDGDSSEEQADILASYAHSMLLRWNLVHDRNDIRTIVSNLESALDRLPHSSTKARYGLLIRVAQAYESWYQTFKDNFDALQSAIQFWEDAYALSVIIRRTKEAVRYDSLIFPALRLLVN